MLSFVDAAARVLGAEKAPRSSTRRQTSLVIPPAKSSIQADPSGLLIQRILEGGNLLKADEELRIQLKNGHYLAFNRARNELFILSPINSVVCRISRQEAEDHLKNQGLNTSNSKLQSFIDSLKSAIAGNDLSNVDGL